MPKSKPLLGAGLSNEHSRRRPKQFGEVNTIFFTCLNVPKSTDSFFRKYWCRNLLFSLLTHVMDSNPHIYFLAHALPLLGNFPAYYFLQENSLQITQNSLFLFALKLLYEFSRRAAVYASRI